MNMLEVIKGKVMEEARIWETFNCKDIEEIIKGNLRTIDEKFAQITASFVTNGYYLRRQHDEKMYEAEGYESFEEYVKAVYGKSRSWAKRMMQINEKFSIGGNDPRIDSKYIEYSVSQLQEMLYLEEEQLEHITPDMTIKEIREVRKPEIQEEPVSILGYPLRVYPEGSLIATPGCGKVDCFSCHRDGCELRQVDCYCVEAPTGNPFPCTTLHIVENLKQEVGNQCQFVNEDLAFHRAGDGQPVPCCKECDHPCGYECRRSVAARHEAAKRNICDVARDESINEKHGTAIDELNLSVRTYNVLKRAGVETIEEIQSMTGARLIMIRNMSKRCIDEVRSKLEEYARNKSENTLCDVAHESEEQIPGQMIVEDYPELLPDQKKTDIDIDNGEDNVVIEQSEIVINPPESVMEDEENVIDAEYKEVAAENEETCCQKAVELDELTFSQIAIRDYLYEEERTLAEYEKVNSEDGGLPYNLMMRQRMLVKALRLLTEHEADQDDQEDSDEPEELFLKGKEFMTCARNSLSNLNCEIEHKAWKAALASSGHLKHYLELVVSENTERSELPVLKNNDQRKEWLSNYKEWGLWYRDEHIDVDYYKYDFSDGSRLVVAEYPQRRMYWKANEFRDEHYYHLIEKNKEFYGSKKTFEGQYMHSADSETVLVEFLKNLQKGEKK